MRGDIIPPRRPEQAGERVPGRGPKPMSQQPATPPVTPEAKSPDTNLASNIPLPDVSEPAPQAGSVRGRFTRFFKRTNKLALGIGMTLALLVVLVVGVIIWYGHQLSALDATSDEKLVITVEQGTSLSGIAQNLKKHDLIRNELAFQWYVRQTGKTSSLQSGTYRLSKSEPVPAIVKHLTSGNTDTFSITFLPGATLTKHRQVLIDAGYAETEVDAALSKTYDSPIFAGKPADADLEGFIFGETYNFPADASVEQVLSRTFDQFETVLTKNDLEAKFRQQGFNLYQGITMASIIQREVASPADAAQVAQVFKKRFDMGMQLGSDVTYQYIADKTGQARSVDIDSPYNTRRYAGLPPGPISSPSEAVLIAVGNPAPGDYLYFLSGDDDKTYFARTNEEHEQNIRDHCQKKCQII